ncbi:MAG: carboxypeptidase regulatory-like domain-containing protein [Acidimicrobiales bacterium]
MRVEVTPRHLDVAPGEAVVLEVEVFNASDVIDGYRLSLVGMGRQAFTATPPVLSLFPGTDGVMTVVLVLPAGFPAGPHTMGVKVSSTTEAAETRVEEVSLEVAPVRDVRLTLSPQAVTGPGKATFEVALENAGNVAVEAPLAAADVERHLGFVFLPTQLVVGPGERKVARVRAKGRRPFFGSPVPRPFTVTADDAGGPALEAAGTFVQKPLVPRGILTLLTILGGIALWGLVLLLGVNKAVKTGVAAAKGENAANGVTKAGGAAGGAAGGGAAVPTGTAGGISGVVVAGTDPSGATVALAMMPVSGSPAAPPPTPVPVGSGGKYEFTSLATPASYTLTVAKLGFGPQTLVVALAANEKKTVDVRLLNGDGGISGKVTDGTAVLTNVAVTAVNGQDRASAITLPTPPVGSYSLLRLPTPATYVLTFAKDGYGSESITVALTKGQVVTDRNVVLHQGNGSISGTVADVTGLPVPDVGVVVSRAGAQVTRVQSLNAGSVGFFFVGGLPTPGTYTLEFSKDGYVNETRTITLGDAGNVTDLNPQLNPVTGALAGLLTEDIRRVTVCRPGPLECPVDEVDVKVTDSKGATVKDTTTASSPVDQLGRYSIVGIPAGDYTVTYSKGGYQSQTFRITLAANENRTLDVRLKGVPGTVAGTAQRCTSVSLVLRDGTQLTPPAAARVRANDAYQFLGLATKAEYRLLFVGSTGAVQDAVDVTMGPGDKLTGIDGTCNPAPTTTPSTTTTTSCFLGSIFTCPGA